MLRPLLLVFVGMGVVELVPGSRRLVRALVRWPVYQKYRDDPERAADRAREWADGVDSFRSVTRGLWFPGSLHRSRVTCSSASSASAHAGYPWRRTRSS
jgi:hypothetical protein